MNRLLPAGHRLVGDPILFGKRWRAVCLCSREAWGNSSLDATIALTWHTDQILAVTS